MNSQTQKPNQKPTKNPPDQNQPDNIIEICIFGPDRVGSTYFCDLLKQLPEVLSTHPEYEIFKRKPIPKTKRHQQALELFQKQSNQNQTDQDHRVPRYMRSYLNAWREVAQSRNKDFLLYKILYHQLPVENLTDFINQSPENTIFIVLTRNLLDMYISHRKAKQINTWHQTDTSNLKITFNHPIKFKDWTSPRIEWMEKLHSALTNTSRKYVHIDYDDLHNPPPLQSPRSDTEKLSYILKKLNHIYNKTPIEPNKKIVQSQLIKQDKSQEYFEKVDNYHAMMNYFQYHPTPNINELRKIFEFKNPEQS